MYYFHKVTSPILSMSCVLGGRQPTLRTLIGEKWTLIYVMRPLLVELRGSNCLSELHTTVKCNLASNLHLISQTRSLYQETTQYIIVLIYLQLGGYMTQHKNVSININGGKYVPPPLFKDFRSLYKLYDILYEKLH